MLTSILAKFGFVKAATQFLDNGVNVIGLCSACRARDAHIASIERILWDEREQRNRALSNRLSPVHIEGEQSFQPIHNGSMMSMAERRRLAAETERAALAQMTGDAPQKIGTDFWKNRESRYDTIQKQIKERVESMAKTRISKSDTIKPDPEIEAKEAVGESAGDISELQLETSSDTSGDIELRGPLG